MKSSVIVFLMLLLSLNTFAQNKEVVALELPVNTETKLITYTNVVDVAGVSKSELFKRCLDWCNSYYKNPADVIREKDEASGIIVCKHRFKISDPYDKKSNLTADAGVIQYTMTVNFKEEKFRYTFTEYNLKQQSYFACEKWMDKTSKTYSENWEHYLKQLDQNTKVFISDLQKALMTNTVVKKDDW